MNVPTEVLTSGPAWLSDLRRQALERFTRMPDPVHSDETWRRTPMARLLPAEVRVASPAEAGRSIQAAGPLPEGVIAIALEEAVVSHPELLRAALLASDGALLPESGRFTHLRRAYVSGGAYIRIPKNVRLGVTLYIRHRVSGEGATVFPAVFIELEEGAEATVVEEHSSDPSLSKAFVAPETFVTIGAGASLRYVAVQDEGPAISHLGEFRATLAQDAKLKALFLTAGGGVVRNGLATTLAGSGAAAELIGIVLGKGDQHVEHHIRAEHVAPDTRSDLLFKAAVGDTSRSVFTGNIQIRKSAKRSQGMQTLKNLVLSEHAKADAVPNLEIEADDVSCKHGASMGPVDPEMLFYLQTRGIPEEAAERLVVHGFVEDALRAFDPAPESELSRWIDTRFGRHWGGGEARV